MAKSPLSSVDIAWLRMEDSTNLMMITGVMVFGAPIDFDRLQATLEERLLRFYLRDHTHRITLPAPGDRGTLEDVVSHHTSLPCSICSTSTS